MKKLFLLMIAALMYAGSSWAQVSAYSFGSSAATYTEISAGTLLGSGTIDDNVYNANSIGFTFTYNGIAYSQFSVNANGFIAMGATVVSSYYAISGGTSNNVISAGNEDLKGNTGATLRYELSGSAPNQVLTIQWKDFRHYNATDSYNFQIKLFETTNAIQFVYGAYTKDATSRTEQIGLRGSSSADFNNRSTTTDWAATTAGGTNDATCALTTTVIPSSGLTFTYTPPSCSAPSGVTSSTVTPTTATISWTASVSAPSNGYRYEVRTSGAAGSGALGLTVSGSTGAGDIDDNITGLSASTTYSVYVRSDCGGTFSAWTIAYTFTTPCDAISAFPWNEGFEGLASVGTNLLPNCWTYTNIVNTNYSCNGTCNSNTAHSGTKFIGGTWNFDVWDFTPGFQLVAGTSYDFSYWFKCTDATVGYNVSLLYGNAQNVAAMTTSLNAETGLNIATWTIRKFTFTPASSGVYYFGLHNVSPDFAPNGIAFDDFSLVLTPSCQSPTAVTSSAITATTATISWTAPTPAPANGYQYEVRTSGAAGSGPAGLTTSGSTLAGVVSANISGLTASTNYNVYVRSDCGGTFSTWTFAYSFSTPCASINSFPYTESFSATLNTCWASSEAVAGASYHWTTTTSDGTHGVTGPQAGTHFAFLNVYNASTTYNPYYLKTLTFDLGATPRQVKYYYWLGSDGYTTTPVPLTLQISTNGGSTWTNLYQHTTANSTFSSSNALSGWQLNTVNLGAYAGQTVIFRFVSNSNYGSGFCNQGIDEFVIDDAPSCVMPTAIASSAVTTTTATISWTAPTPAPANGYQYEVRTSGAAGSGPAGLTTSGSTLAGVVSANISGLTASTNFNVYVRSDCGGSFSAWTSSYSFTTPCDAVSVPYTQNFETVTVPAIPNCTSKENAGTGNNWITASAPGYGFTTIALEYPYNSSNAANAWFYTPGINLTAGVNYQLSFKYGNNSTSYVESLKAAYGSSATSSAMTTTLLDFPTVDQAALQNASTIFTPPSTGVYYFGFKCYSITNQWYLFVDDISITTAPAGMWSGGVNSDWGTSGNWFSGTLPTSSDNVVINAGAPNMPVVNSDPATPATCNSLTINTGATLTIAAGKALTTSGATTNNGTFNLESDATGTGSFIDNGTITGTGIFHAKKYLTGAGGATPNGNYWYIGSSVPNALSGVFAAMGDNKLWSYSETPTQGYTEIITNGIPLNPLQGYVARLGATETIDFTGTLLNTGSFGSAGNLTRSAVSIFDGFNLVSNPYPSAIDFGTVGIGLTRTNLETSVWYRSGGQFPTYNWTSDLGVLGGQKFIPAMQAFWILVSPGQTTGTLQTTNAARTHSSHAFYKTNTDNVFRMEVSNGSFIDETAVAFFPDAVNNYDSFDSRKMFSTDSDYPQISSITPDYNVVAINGQAELNAGEDRIIPLEFKTDVSGTFTLDATNIGDFDQSVSVYLEDAEQSTTTDLRQTAAYTFSSGIVDNVTRFKLHFGTLTTSVSSLTDNSSIGIYEYNNAVYVNTHNAGAGLIEVYDILGKKIMSQQSVKGLNILQPKVGKGIYIVKVLTDGKTVTQKVVLSK